MPNATSAPVLIPFFEPKYLVDTDWVVHYLRGKHTAIVRRLQELVSEGIALSSISLAELYYGAYRSDQITENLKGLKDFLARVVVLDPDERIAERFGKEKTALHRAGTPLDNFDLLIGCTALEYNLTLLTNNRTHYERIAGLQIESL